MNKNQSEPKHLGHLSVIKGTNWTWWESYRNIGISDETQFAVVVWLQWACEKVQSFRAAGWPEKFCDKYYLSEKMEARPEGYKTFFMRNSTEHGISTPH